MMMKFILFLCYHIKAVGMLKSGFYQITNHKDGNFEYTPISIAKTKQLSQSESEITAYDFRLATDGLQINTVLNQGACGGCWAFAAGDIAGATHYLNTLNTTENVNIVVSPQHILNCAHESFGCDGGSSVYAANGIAEHGSVEIGCRGYVGVKEDCVDECSSPDKTFKYYIDESVETYVAVNEVDMGVLRQLVVTSGPVLAHMEVYSDFYDYAGGVYAHSATAEHEGGHAVVIYGFGVDVEADMNYWIVKNSWSKFWGEDGFCKMQMGTNESGIETWFFVMNNYLNSSTPRRGVPLPAIQPYPPASVGWDCAVGHDCTPPPPPDPPPDPPLPDPPPPDPPLPPPPDPSSPPDPPLPDPSLPPDTPSPDPSRPSSGSGFTGDYQWVLYLCIGIAGAVGAGIIAVIAVTLMKRKRENNKKMMEIADGREDEGSELTMPDEFSNTTDTDTATTTSTSNTDMSSSSSSSSSFKSNNTMSNSSNSSNNSRNHNNNNNNNNSGSSRRSHSSSTGKSRRKNNNNTTTNDEDDDDDDDTGCSVSMSVPRRSRGGRGRKLKTSKRNERKHSHKEPSS